MNNLNERLKNAPRPQNLNSRQLSRIFFPLQVCNLSEKNDKNYFTNISVSLFTAHSSPVESNDDDDYLADKSDDNDDTDYIEGDDKQKPSSTASSNTEEPYQTQDYIEKSESGRTIVLKCLGEYIDSSSLFIWYNGSMILAQGEGKSPQASHRVSFSKKDGLLTVRDVSSYDDGTFRCRAFIKGIRYETLVHVQINGPPQGITIGHNINNQANIAEETLIYSAGKQSLRFRCNVAKARPDAKIDWIHNGNTILELQQKDHDLKIEDEGVLVIKTLHARHAGEYQCEASNEFGNLKAAFKINVQCKFFMFNINQTAFLNMF